MRNSAFLQNFTEKKTKFKHLNVDLKIFENDNKFEFANPDHKLVNCNKKKTEKKND